MRLFNLILTLILICTMISCEGFLEEKPVDAIIDEIAITDYESAESALAGLYNIYPSRPIASLADMSDEQNGVPGDDDFTLNSIQPLTFLSGIWESYWRAIFRANNVILEIPRVEKLTEEQRDQIIAEAKCIRANIYVAHLTAFWGDIPWTESTDIRTLEKLSRNPQEEVFNNVINDLLEAEADLPVEYETDIKTRTRITKGAATSLLARTYLYQENWEQAEVKATQVINNSSLYQLQANYDDVFVPNSPESIFELWSDIFTNVGIGQLFFPSSLDGNYISTPTDKIENAFEVGDLRKPTSLTTDAGGVLYINKYRDVNRTGNLQEIKEIRLAELYLIRAEARARQNNLLGAAQDLNVIRNRAGLSNTPANDQASMLAAIEQERFVELCFEGHRWIDLVRTQRVDEVMGEFNPNWNTRAKLLPIPQSEIDLNSNLLPQNPGY